MKNIINKFATVFILVFLSLSTLYADPIRIMPLGDSITYGAQSSDTANPRPVGQRQAYRSHLYYKLIDAGYDFDFVGSKSAGQSIVPAFDTDNEGYPGWHSDDIAENVYDYLVQNHADIVLLHIGTNDHGTFTGGVHTTLKQIDLYEEASGKEVKVIIALIIDRKLQRDRTIELFNDNLKALVGWRIRNGDKLTLVDMYRGAGLTANDYVDNTHPNVGGYQKIADVWANAILSPYTPGLQAYPYVLVDPIYIESLYVDRASNSVTFVTDIPSNGIIFK